MAGVALRSARRAMTQRGFARGWVLRPFACERACGASALLRFDGDAAEWRELLKAMPPTARRAVLHASLDEVDKDFQSVDNTTDSKAKPTLASFRSFAGICEQSVGEEAAEADVELTRVQRRRLFMQHGVPFVGFGLVDNGLMIITGEIIDQTLGLWLGISMLAGAALGNAWSNGVGMVLHGTIVGFSNQLGLPDPGLTHQQSHSDHAARVRGLAGGIGVMVGCIFGMFPLLFMDAPTTHLQRRASASGLLEGRLLQRVMEHCDGEDAAA
eukprot:NODE_13286_length_1174_cov_5.478510.p1 GENE.NODE_13286_length_1174_cov_5.478510~~NODE_13286_length_1174_cov_5.478510.p1  ORF type:complete len:291 (+),score=83.68 NODE_13286_length_1174_cov_5.478510:64-873(+)